MERTFGWRHFRVLHKKGQGKDTFVLMAATCDESTQLWVRAWQRGCSCWRSSLPWGRHLTVRSSRDGLVLRVTA